jgi:hypothetical protein
VEENALIAVGDVEDGAGLLRAEAQQVSHRDHPAPELGKACDASPNERERLCPEQPLFGPRLRTIHPTICVR